MSAVCTKCGTLPTAKNELCSLCGLVAELHRQHEAGEHVAVVEACITCTRSRTAARAASAAEYNATTRISHRDCTHPKTKSARTVCREHRRLKQNLPRKLTKSDEVW